MTIVAAALAALGSAPAPAPAPAPAQSVPRTDHIKRIELPAREVHEECVELAVGQRLSYTYSAGRALQFNIHSHAGDKIAYPVRKNARQVRAAYVPHKAQGYCLMWTNPRTKPVTLEYSFEIAAGPARK